MEEKPDAASRKKKAMGGDLVFPIISLVFALYYFYTILDLTWEAQINGFLMGTVLIILVLIFIVRTAVEVVQGKASLSFEELVSPRRFQASRIGLVLSAIAYVVLIPWLGFTLTTFGFLIGAMLILGVRSKVILFSISFALSILGFIFFIILLDTRFPPGPVERLIDGLF